MQQLQLPEVVSDNGSVWMLTLDTTKEPREDWQLLSLQEKVRARSFRQLADRVRAVSTRAALRRLLANYLDRAPETLRFIENSYGKPFLADRALEFNVSHAGNLALLAISWCGAVGVDIELCDPSLLNNNSDLASLLFSPDERLAVGESLEFFECWTGKEAVLKAVGLGIGDALTEISLFRENNSEQYRLVCPYADWPKLQIFSLQTMPEYAAAIALADPGIGNSSVMMEII